ncbi:hypothetical protein FBQ82_19690 [Anaerolineae bacterium CFX7]|nr:hypothetical protein [Anaerolineae bacterium CFX7]
MLHQAIETYHNLLTPDVARESWAQLQDQTKRRGLYFGTRDVVTVLRPRFLTTEQYHFLQNAIRSVMPAFRKAYHAALADETVRAQFRLNDWEERMVTEKFGFQEPSPSARMDSFYLPEQGIVQFTEYNAEIPAAQAYTDVLSQVFYGLRVMGEFQKQYEVRPLPTRNQMLHALLDAWRQWGGTTRPNIAARAARRVAAMGRHDASEHCDSRLERGADVQRICVVPRVFSSARIHGRNRGSARVRISQRQTHGERFRDSAGIQTRTH